MDDETRKILVRIISSRSRLETETIQKWRPRNKLPQCV